MTKSTNKPYKFKSRRSDIAHLYSLIKIDWSDSERVIEKLSALIFTYLSDQTITETTLQPMIEAALAAYGKSVHREDIEKFDDYERIGAFTKSLVDQVSDFLQEKNKILSDDGVNRLRASIYKLLITESLGVVFKRANYEKKILGAGSSLCN